MKYVLGSSDNKMNESPVLKDLNCVEAWCGGETAYKQKSPNKKGKSQTVRRDPQLLFDRFLMAVKGSHNERYTNTPIFYRHNITSWKSVPEQI